VGVVDQKVKIVAEAKIPKASDAKHHKPGGGNVEIFDEKVDFKSKAQAKVPGAKVGSRGSSRQGSRRGSLTDPSLDTTVTDELNTSAA
jgi:hypothetical protein